MVNVMRVKPWRGKWVSRGKANRINDMFETCPVPDRTALHKEAELFKKQMLKLRSETISKGNQW